MRIILDTNIIIGALLKDSTIRRMILDPSFEFYLPEYSIEEIEKHIDIITQRSGLNKENVHLLLHLLLTNIRVVPSEQLLNRYAEARRIIGGIDPEDIPFLALALAIPNDGIWTDDAHFHKQGKVKIWRTRDIILLAGRGGGP